MGETRRFLVLFLAAVAALSFGLGGKVHAEALSVVQEIHVQATVPDRRHIILDPSGQIIKIISNTPDDVTPEAFIGDDTPEKQVPLTSALLKEYRSLVPIGTAKSGILYERSTVLATMMVPSANRGNSIVLQGALSPAKTPILQPSNTPQAIILTNSILKNAVAAGF